MDNFQRNNLNKEDVLRIVKSYMQASAFTDRKLTDTPTDDLQVVNRRFVTMNGTTANRPTSSIIGQSYFDTDLNQPIWTGNGFAWVDANGNPV